jgi:hypothetical protein
MSYNTMKRAQEIKNALLLKEGEVVQLAWDPTQTCWVLQGVCKKVVASFTIDLGPKCSCNQFEGVHASWCACEPGQVKP